MLTAEPKLDTIFTEAIEIIDDAKRLAYLERACGGDVALRIRVQSLVAAHLNAGNFLHEPAVAAAATAAFADSPSEPDVANATIMIGPYQLMECVGEGGMGAVFVADQTHPVKRRVALKLIKPGMDSKEVVRRFEAERQALALMDHPNIAKVLDAGMAETGRPYFVMELVRGLPVTKYCDQANLSARRRLALFIHICRAVQHAHQKGVIHRDIKPSNVLVTLHDGEPVPKVIDFGIAKAVNQQLTEATVYTKLAQLVGTPLYMSPEQAELSGLNIDTRSDVYSLGVLLYELLTGTTPFEAETFRKAGFDEMRRMIREDEPPCPSARVSTLDASARSTVSSKRGLDERQLSRQLHGDIDWIVMKALEKDRNRRYESAGAFAADIERYLADDPVLARPPSAGYRVRKFVRRNRTMLAVVTIVLAAVVGVAGSVGWMAHARSTDQALAGERAGEFLAEADQFELASRWPDAFGMCDRAEAALGQTGGSAEVRERVRDRKRELAFVLRLEEIRLEVSVVRDGRFDHQLVDELYSEAFRKFGIDVEALSCDEAVRKMPAEPIRGAIVVALDGWIRTRKGLNADWKRLLAVAQAADPDPIRLEIREAWEKTDMLKLKQLAGKADLDRLHPNTVELLQQHLTVDDAIPFLKKALSQKRGDFWLNTQLGHRLSLANPPQRTQAISYFRAAVALRPNSPGPLYNLGSQLTVLKEYDEAIDLFRTALRLKPDYGDVYNNLGYCLKQKGAIDDAISAYREAIRLKPDYVLAYCNLGSALSSQKRFSEAVIPLREAIRLDPNSALAHTNLGNVLVQAGTIDESIEAFRTALRLDPNYAPAHNGLGGILCDYKKDYDGAIASFRRALELAPDNFLYHRNLGTALTGKGDSAGGIAAYREALRLKPNDPEVLRRLSYMKIDK